MKKKITFIILVLVLTAFTGLSSEQFNSSTNPAPLDTQIRSMVELGSVYSNIYDITITVKETIRGKKAMNLLKKADRKNGKPSKGYEYILVRVKFEMNGRSVTDNLSFDLGDNPLQWVVLSSDLTEYPRVSLTVPEPALKGIIKSGSSLEGWVAFSVDQKDSKPVMVFDPDSGGATGRGRTLFFKLY